eukprot:m.307150 g.307150  ORF g.307150 m.307150 type:complete len:53 (+) comp15932_c0_seq1:1191-1349(+)
MRKVAYDLSNVYTAPRPPFLCLFAPFNPCHEFQHAHTHIGGLLTDDANPILG